jgi:mRNA interferase MazF
MKEGDVLLEAMRQADGAIKNRPVLCLARMPPFDDLLVCGISSQLQQAAVDFDELITPADADFRSSHLKAASAFRYQGPSRGNFHSAAQGPAKEIERLSAP